MAQPKIPGTGVGRPQMPYGSDGSDWYALLVDALGRLQVAIDFLAHASDHEDGGDDEIDVTALSGLLADDQHVLDAEVLAVAAALVHKARHISGGADELTSTDLLEAIIKRIQVTGPVTLLLGAVADGEFLKRDGTAIVGAAAAGGLYSDYVHIREEQTAGTGGGTFTANDWRTRVLNVMSPDPSDIASIASNQITLEAGTYRVLVSCPAYRVARHKARLKNVTDNVTILIGTSELSIAGDDYCANRSFVVGRFTIAAQKVLEVHHFCETTYADLGLGVDSDFAVVEVYTEVELWKET